MLLTLDPSQTAADPEAISSPTLIIDDQRGQRTITLNQATYSLGRDLNNTIPLYDRAASRHHFLLVRMASQNGGIAYRAVDGDANGKASLNGIKINGNFCRKADLNSGDVISVGKFTTLRYMHQDSERAANQQSNPSDLKGQLSPDESFDPLNTMTTILAC